MTRLNPVPALALAAVLLLAAPAQAQPDQAPLENLLAAIAGQPAQGADAPAATSSPMTHRLAQACCKTCRKGKACGNSCIAATKTCRKPPGCACDAK